MRNYPSILTALLFSSLSFAQSPTNDWRELMNELDTNFYDICDLAETYFDTTKAADSIVMHERKRYERWRWEWRDRIDINGKRIQYSKNLLDLFTNGEEFCQTSETNEWKAVGPLKFPRDTFNGAFPGTLSSVDRVLGIGLVMSVWVDTADTNHIIVGSSANGVFETFNEGETWDNLIDPIRMPACGASSLLVNPNDHDNIYIASSNWSYSVGLAKTTDHGQTWESTALTQNVTSIGEAFAVLDVKAHPSNFNTMYAATRKRIYKSTDGFATKTEITPSPLPLTKWWHIDIDPNNPDHVFASGEKIKRYDASTGTWTDLTQQLNNYGNDTLIKGYYVDMDPNVPNEVSVMVHAVTANISAVIHNIIWMSSDGGNTFSRISTTTYSPGYELEDIAFMKSRLDLDTAFIVTGVNPYYIYRNNGQWVSGGMPGGNNIHDDVRSLELLKTSGNSENIYMGTDGGLSLLRRFLFGIPTPYLSTVEFRKNLTGRGMNVGNSEGIALFPNTDNMLMGMMHAGTVKYKGEDESWKITGVLDGGGPHAHALDPSKVLTSANSCIFYQPNYGEVLVDSNQTHPFYPALCDGDLNHINKPIASDYQDDNLFYVGYNALHSLEVPNMTWTALSPDGKKLTEMVSAPTGNSTEIWFAVEKSLENNATGNIYRMNTVDHVIDTVTNPDSLNFGIVRSIEIDAANPERVWIGLANSDSMYPNPKKVFVTTDSGQSWTNMSNGLPRFGVIALAYDGRANVLYAGMDIGVWYYDFELPQAQREWKCFNNALPAAKVNGLEINECTGKLVAATFGRGVYETDLIRAQEQVNNYLFITSDTTFAGDITMDESIFLFNGARVTVTGTLRMHRNAEIELYPGTQLIVDGGTITNRCGGFWAGINAYGGYSYITNSYFPQSDTAMHGIVELKNGATIEHAKTGVALGNTQNWNWRGGILRAQNATFKNNQRDVQFLEYTHHQAGYGFKPINNVSYLKNCRFITTEPLAQRGTEPYAHVTMHKVKGVTIAGCTFADSLAFDHDDRSWNDLSRIGIHSLDAVYTLDPICAQSGGVAQWSNACFADTTADRNVFFGLREGVRVDNANSANVVSIRGCNFINCWRGVQINGEDKAEIYRNTFEVPDRQNAVGCYLDGSTGYFVENNLFRAYDAQNEGFMGLAVRNSFSSKNETRNNSFESLRAGSVAYDDNDGTGEQDGYQVLCNDMADTDYDIIVMGSNNNPATDISKYQGFCALFSSEQNETPANNTFSTSCSSVYHYVTAKSSSQSINYAYLSGSEPLCYSSLVILDYCGDTASTGGGTICATSQKSSATVLESSGDDLVNDLTQLQDTFGIAEDSIIGRIHANDAASALLTDLLFFSPLLSDSLLIAAIEEKPTPLPDEELLDLLYGVAPLSAAVNAALENRSAALLEAVDDYVSNHSLVISPRTRKELVADRWERQAKKNFEEALRYYQVYDTSIHASDSALALLDRVQATTAGLPAQHEEWQLREARLRHAYGQHSTADSIVNSLPQAATRLADVVTWSDLLTETYSDSSGIYHLLNDSLLSSQWATLADTSGQTMESYNARALRSFLGMEALNSPVYALPTGGSPKRSAAELFEKGFDEAGTELLTLYPNPTTGLVTIEYTLPPHSRSAALRLYSQNGKSLGEWLLNPEENRIQLNLSYLSQGMYLYMLSADGKLIARKKLVITGR